MSIVHTKNISFLAYLYVFRIQTLDKEETYAVHGSYPEGDQGEDEAIFQGFALNEKFEEQPHQYFEEKVENSYLKKNIVQFLKVHG